MISTSNQDNITKNFIFNISPKIRFGLGSCETSIEEIAQCLGERVLVITDKGIANLGLHMPLLLALRQVIGSVEIFDEVQPDPSLSILLQSVRLGKKQSVTGVIGFGGGSSMDIAKLTALIIGSNQEVDEMWGVDKVAGPRLPLCLIPTTAGTGSEVTPVSIITVTDDEKRGVVSPQILPDLAVLDPELTIGLPPLVTATTGIDAMVHAIEAYSSKNPNNNYFSKVLSREALILLSRSIYKAVNDGSDINSRSEMLLGSMFAGIAFANSPVAAVHALAYPLGGIFHISHGLSNSLVLPKVIEFNSYNLKAAEDYSELSEIVFPQVKICGSVHENAIQFSKQLKHLAINLGLPVRLKDINVPREACERLATAAIKQERLLVNNPRSISEADALRIYQECW